MDRCWSEITRLWSSFVQPRKRDYFLMDKVDDLNMRVLILNL
jgi:hypothetical protein